MGSVEKDIIKSSTKLVKYEHDPIREFIINNQEYIVYGGILVILIVGIILLYHKEGFTNIFYKDIIDFDNIDIYYINLDRAHKRRHELESQFKEQGIKATRYSAVDARALPNEAVANILHNPRSQHFLRSVLVDNRRNIGHFGCFLSHVGVYQEFLKSDNPYCLIFEDDAEFKTPTFKRDVNKHMRNVPDDWDIVLFGFHTADDLHYGKNQDTFLKDNIFHDLEHFTGLQGYLINKRSCKKLLDKVANPEWYIDWEIANLTKAGHFKVYGVFEPLVCQPACYTLKFDNKHLQMHHILNCKKGGGMATTFSE
jgi:GR25 family glycosyltransferase involved in LPS biosynthesis